ncbi:probable BOI-related E3 ubiquitin- ligase 3 [Olea europaea subsp. europaea]|uniref:Probable BOI-related E3 ubiquitin- ligase 3 n=1 Tax=Olea europaea subsp. europaea TaxID=158383 RepID=A0A8S0PXR4_OLEEU|nr:probable BOI-related E3 ubiquitin- ligase 3 [Olea europaea subsp. europaea]
MAVEARHLTLFPPQILSNREMAMNAIEGNGNMYSTPLAYGAVATTTATHTVLPMYGSAISDSAPAKTGTMKSDSGLTYAVPISRKRSRDAINPLLSSYPSVSQNQNANHCCGSITFLGEDISFQIQQQQSEIDRFITQHMDKVRMEIEGTRARYSQSLATAVEENIMKKLKAKEEEVEKIVKLNWALEERVKSLCVENQIWRDLAQTNEATAKTLRCHLEKVLTQVKDEQQQRHCGDDAAAALIDDAQSCCGSNFDEIDRLVLPECSSREFVNNSNGGGACTKSVHNTVVSNKNRMCRRCGKEESCVLLLPCRHLCLCTLCGSSLHTCPICNSTKTASVHVKLS